MKLMLTCDPLLCYQYLNGTILQYFNGNRLQCFKGVFNILMEPYYNIEYGVLGFVTKIIEKTTKQ